MKPAKRLLAIVLAILLMIPTVLVSAESTKADEIVYALYASDMIEVLNATVTYEDDVLTIEYTNSISSYSNFVFPYSGTVIEYVPEEATNYDEAVKESSQEMYALQVLFAALAMNGYTDEEITAYFSSEDNSPTYEINGFEVKEVGEEQTFTSDDGFSTITGSSLSVKVDVSRANLNGADDAAFAPTATTVPDVADHLRADESFTSYSWEDGTVVFENDIYSDGECLYIDHTDYLQNYHSTAFDCVDDVLTYEPFEMTDFYDAQYVSESQMWAMIILQYALKANGYSAEEIAAYFGSADSHPTMELNGFEFVPAGEAQTFEGDYTLTVTPLSITIDLAKANLNIPEPEPVSEEESSEPENGGSGEVSPIGETENSTESSEPIASPKTGDTTGTIAIALLLVSLAAGLTVIRSKKAAE